MKKLTEKELQIMSVLWEHEEVSMRELIEMVPDFKSVSTLVTFVRRLEVHGMITHRELGRRFYLYSAAVTREKYLQTIQRGEPEKHHDLASARRIELQRNS